MEGENKYSFQKTAVSFVFAVLTGIGWAVLSNIIRVAAVSFVRFGIGISLMVRTAAALDFVLNCAGIIIFFVVGESVSYIFKTNEKGKINSGLFIVAAYIIYNLFVNFETFISLL